MWQRKANQSFTHIPTKHKYTKQEKGDERDEHYVLNIHIHGKMHCMLGLASHWGSETGGHSNRTGTHQQILNMGTILGDLGGVKITASGHTNSRHMPKKKHHYYYYRQTKIMRC